MPSSLFSFFFIVTALVLGAVSFVESEKIFSNPGHWQLDFLRSQPDSPEGVQGLWQQCEVVSSAPGGFSRAVQINRGRPVLEVRPAVREENHRASEAEFVVCRGVEESHCLELLESVCAREGIFFNQPSEAELAAETAADELFEFNINGPAENRISLVFMGDGYTASQRADYIADMERLVADMFTDITFKSYLPTMNIYGVFRASRETGIGSGGRPRDTSFQLYRDGTELRGVYTAKPQEARNACRKAPACHFPSLIGNDEYYGGLGGEFTISTRSVKSGTVVLRHEMGHNLVSVGEEYDGGAVYRGVNFASSLGNIGWKHWLTEPTNIREEVSEILVQDYAWYDLARGLYRIPFSSKGDMQRWYLQITVSGAETDDSIEVTLDGRPLDWRTEGDLDRTFYRWYGQEGFSAGSHELTFRQVTPPRTGGPIRQLCSITLHEYAAEPDYHWDDRLYIGAYKTYRQGKALAGYRPNSEHCLMRNMTSPHLCVVCQEGLWMHFLSKMSLIDSVDVQNTGSRVEVKAAVVPLGQFRPPTDRVEGEFYEVKWIRNGQEQRNLADRFEFTLDPNNARGKWTMQLKFHTPEIRADPRRLTEFEADFTIP